jgi:hypothetical protein
VHNVELRPGKGAQVARSAGMAVQLMAKEGKFAQLRMPSGEVRSISLDCMAVIGGVGNADHENLSVGKAGRSLVGHPSAIARRSDESRRSSPWRRRREISAGQSPPGITVGLAHEGEEDAQD